VGLFSIRSGANISIYLSAPSSTPEGSGVAPWWARGSAELDFSGWDRGNWQRLPVVCSFAIFIVPRLPPTVQGPQADGGGGGSVIEEVSLVSTMYLQGL